MPDTATAQRHKRGGIFFDDFVAGEVFEHRYYPHRDADGQHAVLQHDAQSAAAPHRPAFLRAGDRMGPAADELAVHARPDDRHLGHRHHRRHHHRQSRHDRGEIPPSAVRGRHRPCTTEVIGKRESKSRPGAGIVELLSPRLQPGRQAGRRMPPPGLHPHAARPDMRSLLFVPADSPAKLDKALGCGADAIIVDLEDSIAPERKAAARDSAAAFLADARGAPHRPPRGPLSWCASTACTTGLTDADLDAIVAGAAGRHHAAEGGRRRRHHPCRRQAHRPRGDSPACPTGTSRSSRSRPRPRRRCSSPAPIAARARGSRR